jgi:adenylyltransferase/sulfurtransferase
MQETDAATLRQWLQQDSPPVLLDVREPGERAAFHIGGLHIPLSQITRLAEQIPANRPVVVYCRKGIRSQIAIQRLETRFGYTNLVNLKNGLQEWK